MRRPDNFCRKSDRHRKIYPSPPTRDDLYHEKEEEGRR